MSNNGRYRSKYLVVARSSMRSKVPVCDHGAPGLRFFENARRLFQYRVVHSDGHRLIHGKLCGHAFNRHRHCFLNTMSELKVLLVESESLIQSLGDMFHFE